MRVMKFGGTSVGSGEMMRQVAEIVAREDDERVVVASAMSGVTDALEEGARTVREDETAVKEVMEGLRRRHDAAAARAMDEVEHRNAVLAHLAEQYERLERLLYGIAYTEELTHRTRDLVHAFGERLSVRLLAGALRDAGVDAVARDADDIGILTDGRFGNATPRMDAVERNVRKHLGPLLEEGTVPVVSGYFGCDEEGHVTTFGRGGSDFSAAILSAALEVDRLEVWKDVDGFLTADPTLVPDAVPLSHMTYDEAAELAYVGAQVLHPRTVEPVRAQGIPIVVRNTTRPEVDGSTIQAELPEGTSGLRSAAVKPGLAILRLYGPGMAYTPGIGQEVFTALGEERINVYNMAASQASFALLIDASDLPRGREVLGEHVHGVIQGVDGHKGRSLVTVVGQGLGSTHGVAGRIFETVGGAGINVEMISVGASDIALNFVVRTEDAQACLQALHDAFLKENGSP